VRSEIRLDSRATWTSGEPVSLALVPNSDTIVCLVALSSGNVSGATTARADEIARHTRNAEFVRDVGGHYLQLVDSAMPKGRKPVAQVMREPRLVVGD